MPIDPAALEGTWIRSSEEDSPGERVYRDPEYSFPPARGRESFELRPGGVLVERGPGPTDIPVEGRGTWELRGDELVLRGEEGERTLVLVAVEPDRLVARG